MASESIKGSITDAQNQTSDVLLKQYSNKDDVSEHLIIIEQLDHQQQNVYYMHVNSSIISDEKSADVSKIIQENKSEQESDDEAQMKQLQANVQNLAFGESMTKLEQPNDMSFVSAKLSDEEN